MALKTESFLLRRYIEKAMVDLPAMPAVIMEVIRATDRDGVTTNEVESLLSKDPALATKVLKVVNSAYFGLPRQITNISHAVAILGFQQVRNLAMSLGVLNALSSTNPRVQEIQMLFWQHSFASGTAAELIAKRKGLQRKDVEMIFVGGLLHDIGRLFLLTLFNIPYQQVMKESIQRNLPVRLVEKKVLGTSHAELGADLAEKWNFPDELVSMIRCHDGEFPPGEPYPEYCIHIADILSDAIAEQEFVGLKTPILPRAADWAGFKAEDYEEIKLNMIASVERAKQVLGML
jgi:putative nucleotidyltransferase with HDIG domain